MAVRRGIAVVCLALLSSSCLTIGVRYVSSGVQAVVHDIDYPAPAPVAADNGLILRIRDFSCSAEYDVSNMVFVDEDGLVTKMSHNRWAANPATLLGDLLCRDLVTEEQFLGIYRRTPIYGDDLVLEGHLREFGARETDGSWRAVLEIEVILLESARGTIIFQEPYVFSAPIDSTGDFRSLADGMSGLVRQWSESVRSDLRAIYGAPR